MGFITMSLISTIFERLQNKCCLPFKSIRFETASASACYGHAHGDRERWRGEVKQVVNDIY